MDLHEQGASSRTFVIAAIVCVLLQAGLAPQIFSTKRSRMSRPFAVCVTSGWNCTA